MTQPKVLTQINDLGEQLSETTNDFSYTLNFLNNLNKIRTRTILEVNGFYSIEDGAVGKYRVLAVNGSETWSDIEDSQKRVIFQISNEGEIRGINGTKKLKVKAVRKKINAGLYGVQGDWDGTKGMDNTKLLQAALNSGNNVDMPDGFFRLAGSLTIQDNFYKRTFSGNGNRYTPAAQFYCETYPAINVVAGGVTIQKMSFVSATIRDTEDCFINAYKIQTNLADIDLTVLDCGFTGLPYGIKAKGRNVVIEKCLVYDVQKALLKVDFPTSVAGENSNDPYIYDNLKSGMRGYILNDNRIHYSEAYLLENLGHNSKNITGVQITNNFLESGCIVHGALKDAVVTGNEMFQLSLASAPFNCSLMKNVTITGNVFKGEDSYNNLYETSMDYLVVCPEVENIVFDNNVISNVRQSVFRLVGTTNSFIIGDNNIFRRVCTISGSLVTFTGTEHNDIKIGGIVESPERSNWIAVSKNAQAVVKKYDIPLTIKGEIFEAIHNLIPESTDVYSKTTPITNFYVGNGSGDKTINLLYTPKLFELSSNDGMFTRAIYGSSGQYANLGNGIVTINTAMNTSGKVYIYTYR